MKINWKIRLKNKSFVVAMAALVIAFVYQVLAAFGLVPKISQDTVTQIVGIVVNMLAALGVLVDPTTSGIADSMRALTYGSDEDVRSSDAADTAETGAGK